MLGLEALETGARLPVRGPEPSPLIGPSKSRTLLHVRDHNGQALAFVYCEDEPGRRASGKLLTRDEARRVADIAKLPELLQRPAVLRG